jgi:hypothetical protein
MFLHNASTDPYSCPDVMRGCERFVQSYSNRFSGIHICLPESHVGNMIRAGIMMLLGKENRSRIRWHYGE